MKDETDKNHHDQYFVVSRTQQKGPLLGCSVDGGNHDFNILKVCTFPQATLDTIWNTVVSAAKMLLQVSLYNPLMK